MEELEQELKLQQTKQEFEPGQRPDDGTEVAETTKGETTKGETAEFLSSSALSESKLSESESPPRKRNLLSWLLRGFVFGGVVSVSAAIGGLAALMAPLPAAIAPRGGSGPISINTVLQQGFRYQITHPVNILVLGVDNSGTNDSAVVQTGDRMSGKVAAGKDPLAGNSDTMLLVHIDPARETMNVLSIPRDTQVNMPGEGTVKINYANMAGGAKLSAQVVSQNLNGVAIDRYVRIDTAAFRDLVDLLGGVRVFVPEPMHYQDDTQHLYINLNQGWQTLNGKQAEGFARFRHDQNGDIGRVQRQQQLIRALREKLTSPAMITRLPQAIQIFQKYIDTNLSPEEMLSLADFGLGLEKDSFRMVMLPGRFSRPDEFVASYWLMDATTKDQLMSEYFDVSSVATMSQHQNSSNLRIAIQNASGDPLLGSQVASYLQDKGFSNVYVINDGADRQQHTQIIVQRGDLQSATSLESVLGLGQVVSASTGDLDSDLTILVGEDWAKRPRI